MPSICDYQRPSECEPRLIRGSGRPKYVFRLQVKSATPVTTLQKDIALYDYLTSRKRTNVSMTDQLRLALKLALTVFRLHSTSWLTPDWGLAHLTMMRYSEGHAAFCRFLLGSMLLRQNHYGGCHWRESTQVSSVLSPHNWHGGLRFGFVL